MRDSRLDHADSSSDAELELTSDESQISYQPVKVEVVNPVATTTDATDAGNYYTVVIPASTATVASVAQILPRDPRRQYAYIQTIDAPIVLSTSQQDAENIANVAATFPTGAYAGGWSPAIRHNEPVWACNTSTTTTCRVSVLVEYGPTS
jgi:hypothetical protein